MIPSLLPRRTAINPPHVSGIENGLPGREFSRLVAEIGKKAFNSRTFWIFCHENPDGDTIGCSLATYAILREMGKDVTVFTPHPIPRMYRFLPLAEDIVHTETLPEGCPEVVMFMDNASFDRVGPSLARQLTERGIGPRAAQRNRACTLINIDHHMSNEGYGDLNLIDPSASACGEIFYHAFRQLRLPITYAVAVNIYATILTDTGRFSYGNTNYQTFQIASELIRLGVNPFEVVDRVYNTRTPDQIKLLADILGTIKADDELGFFYCYVTQAMLNQTGNELTDTEGAVDIMKTVGDYDVCFFFKEEEDGRVKVSARSNGDFDVSEFSKRFGGGGHPAASGFRLGVGIREAPGVVGAAMREVRQALSASPQPATPIPAGKPERS